MEKGARRAAVLGMAVLTTGLLTAGTAHAAPSCAGRPATIVVAQGESVTYGTPGDDVIVGTAAGEYIAGMEGNDVICGGGGNDQLDDGEGNDEQYGESGDDELRSVDFTADLVDGGPGHDWARGDDIDRFVSIES